MIGGCARARSWVAGGLLLIALALAPRAGAQDRVIVAWDETLSGPSFVRAIEADPPWAYATPALATDAQGVVHVSGNLVYHLSLLTGRLLVIDATDWTVERTHDFGAAEEPRDVTVVSATTAYLARAKSTQLARVDLVTGALTDVVDLGPFADADGFPEMERMIAFDGRLYVQLRRVDFSPSPGRPVPPMLAVVDLETEELVDADPTAPGVQAITLAGTSPRFKMQVLPTSRRLLLSATGAFHDGGGLEMIDLATLQSLGLVVPEFGGDVGADLGAFRMYTEQTGYLAFSTDLLLSSHLHRFSLSGGVEPTEHHFALDYFVPHLALDRSGARLFWPEPGGVHVFDTATGDRLTPAAIPFAGLPSDLELAIATVTVPGLSRPGLILTGAILLGVGVIAARRRLARSAG